MNQEIEIKVLLNNPEKVLSYLNKKAEPEKTKEQEDIYYVMPHVNFFLEKPVYRYLRVRIQEKKSVLEFHVCHLDKNNKLLWTDEYETIIDNPKILMTIFSLLGIKDYVTVHKLRHTYKIANFIVTIDKIKDLGVFAEVEKKSTKKLSIKMVSELKQEMYHLLAKIGAEWSEVPKLGYPDMIIEKRKKK